MASKEDEEDEEEDGLVSSWSRSQKERDLAALAQLGGDDDRNAVGDSIIMTVRRDVNLLLWSEVVDGWGGRPVTDVPFRVVELRSVLRARLLASLSSLLTT
jgi:hypothetical protein